MGATVEKATATPTKVTTCGHGYTLDPETGRGKHCPHCAYEAQFPDEFIASGRGRMNPGRNFDYPMAYEGKMAKSYLWAIEKDARALRQQLQDDDDLPGWVQAKIVTAQDRIGTVNRYMGHKIATHGARKNPGTGLNWAGAAPWLLASAGLVLYVRRYEPESWQAASLAIIPAVIGVRALHEPQEAHPHAGSAVGEFGAYDFDPDYGIPPGVAGAAAGFAAKEAAKLPGRVAAAKLAKGLKEVQAVLDDPQWQQEWKEALDEEEEEENNSRPNPVAIPPIGWGLLGLAGGVVVWNMYQDKKKGRVR
jgi:hypothetical protein